MMVVPSGVIVCSHRGPVSFALTGNRLVARPAGPGGLVPVMGPAIRSVGGIWIAAAITDSDHEMARAAPEGMSMERYRLRLLSLPPGGHREQYEVVSVEHLGKLFHYLYRLPIEPGYGEAFRHAWRSYRLVNRRFARSVLELGSAAPVLVQDFHLLCVGQEIRRLDPTNRQPILFFHHVPWCEPDYFSVLPAPVRDEILRAVLAYDVVGFHSARWARAFIACCERYLPGATCSDTEVRWRNRRVSVVAVAACIDAEAVRAASASRECERWLHRLTALRAGRRVLIRVDRADLWKNMLRGFEAFELLLERRPDLSRHLWFLALTSRTRSWVPEYRTYLRRCQASARRINERFGGSSPSEQPVTLLIDTEGRSSHARALAGLRLADAVLINPLFDGLNIVAKEAVAVAEHSAALVLSRNAGVYEQFRSGVEAVNPFDVIETAEAIERAIELGPSEMARRARFLNRVVQQEKPARWVQAQLDALG